MLAWDATRFCAASATRWLAFLLASLLELYGHPTELRFSALLTEGEPRVHFHREGFGRFKEDLA
jgi:hypothetical protein